MLSKKQIRLIRFLYGNARSLDEIMKHMNMDNRRLAALTHNIDDYFTEAEDFYVLTSMGEAYIEAHLIATRDRVVTRIIAIIGAITGVLSLLWLIIDTVCFS